MDHWEQYVDPHHEIEERSWWEEIQGMNRFDMGLLCVIELHWAIVQGRNVYSLKSWNIRVDLWNCCAFPDFVKISYFLKRILCNYVDNKVTSEFCWEERLKKKKTKYGSSILGFYEFLSGRKKYENKKICEKWTYLNHFSFFMVICFGLIYFNMILFGINCAISICQMNNRFWVMMKEDYE